MIFHLILRGIITVRENVTADPFCGLAGCRNAVGQCWTASHICAPHKEESHGYVDLSSIHLEVAKLKALRQMPEILQESHYLLQFRIE